MKLAWPANTELLSGNFLGYSTASRGMRDALLSIGVEITDDADVAVHFCHPADFRPIHGRRNILFTMYEGTPVPPVFEDAFRQADGLLVPSRFCRSIFETGIRRTRIRTKLVPLGFDPKVYTRKLRTWDQNSPFVFLWTGARNARKGHQRVASAWGFFFQDVSFARLIMKTTSDAGEPGKVRGWRNIIADTRRYETAEQMAELYHAAHCLLAPSYGEGFGLHMLEAAATGLPIITVKWSAPLDFLDSEVAYFCSHKLEKTTDDSGAEQLCAFADVPDLGRTMVKVMKNYEIAARKGTAASRRAHQRWTWERAARSLVAAVKGIVAEGGSSR